MPLQAVCCKTGYKIGPEGRKLAYYDLPIKDIYQSGEDLISN